MAEKDNLQGAFARVGWLKVEIGKGGPSESRPIVKSEFCQIPPNRLQLIDRILLMWGICLSTIGQSIFFDESAESLTSEHTRDVI
jgi:hypothetical protein